MRFYSYAGESTGTTDPETVDVWSITGEACPITHCDVRTEHTVIMWSGNEYSRDKTWIAAPDEWTADLEDMR